MTAPITWRGFTITLEDDGVYRAHVTGLPISIVECDGGWLAAVGGGSRMTFGTTPEIALHNAAKNTLARAESEVVKWSELKRRIREVVGC